MKKKLIIAEKPSLAIKIVEAIKGMTKHDGYYENSEYIVTFAFGHLLRLKDIDQYMQREKTKWKLEELPFFPQKFEYTFPADTSIIKQYEIVKRLYLNDSVETIINAGDPDREGCVIINNIINRIQEETNIFKDVQRVWLTATTPEFVRSELKNLKDNQLYDNYFNEGLARTFIDWLYGINMTRYISLKAGSFLPVGRVLVPIVKFIYDRDISIKNFKSEKYFELTGIFTKDNIKIASTISNSRYSSQSDIDTLFHALKDHKGIVKEVITKNVKKQPPKLYSLDKLQNQMNKLYKYSPSETLNIVQLLYEAGFVTYPRTNTEYLSTAEKKAIESLINSVSNHFEINMVFKDTKSIFDDSKVEGHTALIITSKFPELTTLSDKEQNVYNAILNRFISNFLDTETVIQETKVEIEIDEEHSISLSGNCIQSKGFYEFEPPKKEIFLPAFKEGEEINMIFETCAKETKPPASVTEVELNEFLKNPFKKKELLQSDDEEYVAIMSGCEIGTVATRATIIDNTIRYQYIEKKNNILKVAEKGIYLIEALDKLNINLNREKTVELSMLLKSVFYGQKTLETVVKSMENEISQIIDTNKEISLEQLSSPQNGICICPKCNTGKILSGKKNYYCSNYKSGCTFQVWKEICGKNVSEANLKKLCSGKKSNKIKGFKGKKGTFDAFIILDSEFKTTFSFN